MPLPQLRMLLQSSKWLLQEETQTQVPKPMFHLIRVSCSFREAFKIMEEAWKERVKHTLSHLLFLVHQSHFLELQTLESSASSLACTVLMNGLCCLSKYGSLKVLLIHQKPPLVEGHILNHHLIIPGLVMPEAAERPMFDIKTEKNGSGYMLLRDQCTRRYPNSHGNPDVPWLCSVSP